MRELSIPCEERSSPGFDGEESVVTDSIVREVTQRTAVRKLSRRESNAIYGTVGVMPNDVTISFPTSIEDTNIFATSS